jgi:hypothetical protein
VQNRKRKISTLFDSGALITSAKFHVHGRLIIDYVVDCCRVNLSPEVKHETIDMGLLFGYQDAQDLANRLDKGNFLVLNTAVRDNALESILTNLGLENADCAVIHTYKHISSQTKLITDDHRLFIATTRLGLAPIFFPDLILMLVNKKWIKVSLASELLEAMKPRYAKGFVELSLKRLKGVI